ncbi:MAG TPA: hypothetical protein VK717_10330 [Opitutaceae bacterium]|jgi:hypothetical protein|nr:hypothetical protein [Opitutaceae bacterium]
MKMKKQTRKQRREKDKARLAKARAEWGSCGGKMTAFYFLPGELERAKALLSREMADPFSLKKRLNQIKKGRAQKAQPAATTGRQEELDLNFQQLQPHRPLEIMK